MLKKIIVLSTAILLMSCTFKKNDQKKPSEPNQTVVVQNHVSLSQDQKEIISLVKLGSPTELKSYLEKSKLDLNFEIPKEKNLLEIASQRNDNEILRILFEAGLSRYISNSHNHWASFANRYLLNQLYSKTFTQNQTTPDDTLRRTPDVEQSLRNANGWAKENRHILDNNIILRLIIEDVSKVAGLLTKKDDQGLRTLQRKLSLNCEQISFLIVKGYQQNNIHEYEMNEFIEKYFSSLNCKKSFNYNLGQDLFQNELLSLSLKVTDSTDGLNLIDKLFFRKSDEIGIEKIYDNFDVWINPGLLIDPLSDVGVRITQDLHIQLSNTVKIVGKKKPDIKLFNSKEDFFQSAYHYCIVNYLSGMDNQCMVQEIYNMVFTKEERPYVDEDYPEN